MAAQLVKDRTLRTIPRTWARGLNTLAPEVKPEPRMPEPTKLYALVVMAFQLHVPDEKFETLIELCSMCREPWPCDQVRLAFRIREGF